MAKRVHVAGIFVSCMSSVPRAFVRTANSRATLTIHAKLFTFTRVKRVHARVHTHACVKFKVSGTVYRINKPRMEEIGATIPKYQPLRVLWRPLCDYARRTILSRQIRPFTRQLVPSLFEESISQSS